MRAGALLFFLLLTLDQLTKYLAYSFLQMGESVPVISGLFSLTLVYNPGAAFGMFSGLADPYRHIALGSVSVIAIIVVVRFMIKEAKGDMLSTLALFSILSGAVGNIIDRFRFDAVVDFLDFYYGSYHWPAFNVADSAISVGVVVLIVRLTFFVPSEHEPAEDGVE